MKRGSERGGSWNGHVQTGRSHGLHILVDPDRAAAGSWMMAVLVRGQHANHRQKKRPGLTLEEKGAATRSAGAGGGKFDPRHSTPPDIF